MALHRTSFVCDLLVKICNWNKLIAQLGTQCVVCINAFYYMLHFIGNVLSKNIHEIMFDGELNTILNNDI